VPRFIVTGCYTGAAFRGMIANPSDREAAARGLIETAGGKLETYYLTTGATDFTFTAVIDDAADLLAGLMVAAAAGAISDVRTQRAFTAAEFMAIQKKAGGLAAGYKAPA
jgi:uncharacterized protein with GYD domain